MHYVVKPIRSGGVGIGREKGVAIGSELTFLDTPAANPAAIALAERHGMKPVFETARMYTKGSPAGRIDRCFGVTTFELG
jgi:hypothetical protein